VVSLASSSGGYEQVISMLEFLIDNIFVSFGGTLFQQVIGIPMGTNCADFRLSKRSLEFFKIHM
jgi:hypothetical protein